MLETLASKPAGSGVTNDEYDPAHPTDEIEEDSIGPSGDKPSETGANTVKKDTDDEYDPAHPTDDVSSQEDVIERSPDLLKSVESGDKVEDEENETNSANSSSVVQNLNEDSLDFVLAKDSIDESDFQLEKDSSECVNIECNEKETDARTVSDLNVENESNKHVSLNTNKKDDNHTVNEKSSSQDKKTPQKLSPKSISGSSVKVSPSVKVTEFNKKSPSSVKPFEINRKALLEKKQLFGGNVDHSKDDIFTLDSKKIEDAFKDTKAKSSELDKHSEDIVSAEVHSADGSVELSKHRLSVEKESNTNKDKPKDKSIKEETFKSDNLEKVKDTKNETKRKDSKEKDDKLKSKSLENSEKPSKKGALSERFKKGESSKVRDNLDEEDPIHEMRKLDKQLSLEFGDSDYERRKNRDPKKVKRKVSLDDDSGYSEKNKNRKDAKERRGDKYGYVDVEEGELNDDMKKERRKKEKKKKKMSDDNDDSDTRIVIQVQQNTEDRTVWEEDEKKKKREKEEKRKEKDLRKDKKHKRGRSRSRSYERKNRSRSRDRHRSGSRSRDRNRKKRRERSKEKSLSREKSLERSHKKKKKDRNRSRSKERESVRSRNDWSRERSREKEWSRDRDYSLERSRGRDRKRSREYSPDRVDMFGRSRSPYGRKEFLKDKVRDRKHSGKLSDIIDDVTPTKKQRYEEVSSESDKMSPNTGEVIEKIETVHRIETTRDHSHYDDNDKDDEYDDEPEETEQFQYTDRDEYLGQNKSKQQRQNLITIEPRNPNTQPPLPEPISTPTPPLPPVGDFTQFPPPPTCPPPKGPPPGSVIMQEPPPGQGLLGEGPLLLQGPPPPLDGPQGLLQQPPNMSLPMSLNVLPGFHRGLPPTISQQRQLLVSPLRQAIPRLQTLPNQGIPRLGEVLPSQVSMGGPNLQGQMMNGPFEGRPPNSDLPPGHPHFAGDPQQQLLPISTSTPPPNMRQLSRDDQPRPLLPQGHEHQLIHIGPDPRAPPPRLPIPLLPPASEATSMSVMVSMPPPNSNMMSMPPHGSQPNSVSAILGLARMGAAGGMHQGELKPMQALNQLEKISELLNTQNKLMGHMPMNGDGGLFKVPLPPGGKGGKSDAEMTEVVDMDMGSPIMDEGNIELPVSPQFDNLIDNPEDLLEEDFKKKTEKSSDKDINDKSDKDRSSTPSKTKELKDADSGKKDSVKKTKEERHSHKKHSKENRHHHHSRRHKDAEEGDFKKMAMKDAQIDLDSQDMPSSAVEMTNKEKVGVVTF